MSNSNRDEVYGGTSAKLPTPQAEVATYHITNDKSIIPFHDSFNWRTYGHGNDKIVGTASSDKIQGFDGNDIIFGGASRDEDGFVAGSIERMRSGAFVSANDLAAVRADPNAILAIYAKYKAQFKAYLGVNSTSFPKPTFALLLHPHSSTT